MNNLPRQIGQRLFVLAILLCAFSVIYIIGCFAVARTALMGDYVG